MNYSTIENVQQLIEFFYLGLYGQSDEDIEKTLKGESDIIIGFIKKAVHEDRGWAMTPIFPQRLFEKLKVVVTKDLEKKVRERTITRHKNIESYEIYVSNRLSDFSKRGDDRITNRRRQ